MTIFFPIIIDDKIKKKNKIIKKNQKIKVYTRRVHTKLDAFK